VPHPQRLIRSCFVALIFLFVSPPKNFFPIFPPQISAISCPSEAIDPLTPLSLVAFVVPLSLHFFSSCACSPNFFCLFLFLASIFSPVTSPCCDFFPPTATFMGLPELHFPFYCFFFFAPNPFQVLFFPPRLPRSWRISPMPPTNLGLRVVRFQDPRLTPPPLFCFPQFPSCFSSRLTRGVVCLDPEHAGYRFFRKD